MSYVHGRIQLEIIEAKGLPNVDFGFRGKSDPFVVVTLIRGEEKVQQIAKTRCIDNNLNPRWQENFRVDVCHDKIDSVSFDVMDEDSIGADFMCNLTLPADKLARGDLYKGWYALKKKKGKAAGSIHLSMSMVNDRVRGTDSNEVPDVVFPMRSGCLVKLYQDAHTPAVPPVTDVVRANGQHYQPTNLWVETVAALKSAKKLIYILGWSVKADVELVRGGEKNETLSEILIKKASEGVRVLIMLWDEAMSTDLNSKGMMKIHDEETRKHFQNTEVEVVLAPRRKQGAKLRQKFWAATMYTHHQKCVIVDAHNEQDPSRRRLVAYVGGLDLTDGRWDTPAHELYSTLTTDHKSDFYNKAAKSTVEIGPRQPWHDIHMYVEGKPAHDVVMNFVERWKCQADNRENKLLPLDDREFDLNWKAPEEDSSWNVQFFRSINSDSAEFDFNSSGKLLSKMGRLFDDSIHQAYIHHIRRAKRFIYIENQYFLGSSTSWKEPNEKSPHLIPLELTMKIVNAINAGEDFKVYVLIPIHSEGDPKGSATQEILRWQRLTMDMMYSKIAKAISQNNVKAHPTDYLSFFCLGKQETKDKLPEGLKDPPKNSSAMRARDSMRFMIYVHSKMAIFDDEYIIVGSANINERSMNGNRDTEMCLGAYQPRFTKENFVDSDINGDVRDFRLALWAEHCGAHLQEHLKPGSQECMNKMKDIGDANLRTYASDGVHGSESHWMSYPVAVTSEGTIENRPGLKEFPGTGGLIFGSANNLPDALTT